jgi:hypothetical protein
MEIPMRKLRFTIDWQAFRRLPLAIMVALVWGGCATEPTRYSVGPIKAHTFNFVHMDEGQKQPYADNRAEVHTLIQNAIEKNLASKGLTMVETNGDVAVLYLVIISSGASTKTINDYFGYGDSAYDLQDKAHQAFVIDKRSPGGYGAGTLVIDIVNAKQGKVLWRNFVYRPIFKDLPLEKRQQRLQEAVDEAFKDLQIAR